MIGWLRSTKSLSGNKVGSVPHTPPQFSRSSGFEILKTKLWITTENKGRFQKMEGREEEEKKEATQNVAGLSKYVKLRNSCVENYCACIISIIYVTKNCL